jgi:hypothetical protein
MWLTFNRPLQVATMYIAANEVLIQDEQRERGFSQAKCLFFYGPLFTTGIAWKVSSAALTPAKNGLTFQPVTRGHGGGEMTNSRTESVDILKLDFDRQRTKSQRMPVHEVASHWWGLSSILLRTGPIHGDSWYFSIVHVYSALLAAEACPLTEPCPWAQRPIDDLPDEAATLAPLC